MPWVTVTSETITAANQRQVGVMTGSKPCAGLPPNSLLPVGWRYEQQVEVDSEGVETGPDRKVFISPTGAVCVVGGDTVESGTYGALILLGAAAAVFYLIWRGR